ncbi:hypothetical protein IV203_012151 [Nitzschia inconspicua]|uniref:Uncharacterized protein n=1 Tax=Nitzschia inconspicua TaxID=303405 RepID=A0A9K3KUF6_9STRA|nr:hypothetical protein IV203_012151 [Nitzschia inconspicua]
MNVTFARVTLTTRGDNLSRWHRLFRTREAFLHPNLEARVGRDPLPPFLRMFPDAATEIKQFCRVNLLNLNVETVHQFILNKVFPRIYAVWASEEVALEVLKSTSKPPLTASPFVRKLLIGINNEGYWNSNHMAVQFVDVVDCLKVLYPSHEFVFLFDHSQGHNRKRKGALDVNNMNVSFGDFQNELTHLQVMANELKVQVMFTPKFHAEMAGEGIEYSWGFVKGSYRRKPLQKKRKRADFEDLVDKCTNVETELTKARIRKFSALARAYLCTYHYLATAEPTAAAIKDNDQEKKQKVPMMDEIESLMNKFKTHRCALGFVMDHGSFNPTSHTEIREL